MSDNRCVVSDCERVARLFAACAARVIQRKPHGSAGPAHFPRESCPDELRGVYEFDAAMESGGHWGESTGRDLPLLVLVLESPHIDEFEPGPGFRAKGPAKGSTGVNIRFHLGRALRAVGLRGQMDVLLVNAIQHQCSLGSIFCDTSTCRDEIFIDLWDDVERSAELCFKQRLIKAIDGKREVTLVNCCTLGDPKLRMSLRERVQIAIEHIQRDFAPDARIVRRAHPSSRYWRLGTTWESTGT